MSIRSSIDIATKIIAMNGLRRPQSYRDTFGILAGEGILSRDLTTRPLSGLAGFQKVLVYICRDPDLAQVYGILQ